MSRNQKAPLLAFVLVALVCGLVLVDSVRGDASGPSNLVSPPPQNPLSHLVPTPPTAVDGVPAETSTAPSAGQAEQPAPLGDPPGGNAAIGPVGEDDLAATQQEAVGDPGAAGAAGSAPANSIGDSGPGSGAGPGQAQGDPPTNHGHQGHPGHPGGPDHPGRPDNPGQANGAGGQGRDGAPGLVRKAKKNPNRGLATLGPDGGRPEIDPEDPEPLPEPPPETGEPGRAPDAGGPHKPGEEPADPAPAPEGPAPPAEPAADPAPDPAAEPAADPAADPGPDALPIDPERGMQEQVARSRAEADQQSRRADRKHRGKGPKSTHRHGRSG